MSVVKQHGIGDNMTTIKEQTWSKAPIICELNGYKWLLGPEAEQAMTWQEAIIWCHSKGGILPPRDVLLHAYMNEDTKKEFTETGYWSSTALTITKAWLHFFSNGSQGFYIKTNVGYVRAVRAIKLGESK
jgi:hypothetical protein